MLVIIFEILKLRRRSKRKGESKISDKKIYILCTQSKKGNKNYEFVLDFDGFIHILRAIS